MKRVLIICMYISFLLNLEATSLNAVYRFELNAKYSFSLHLYSNNEYKMVTTTSFTNDMLSSSIISSGSYTLNNNKIVLYDSINGFELVYLKQRNYIIAQKSFILLKNKQMNYIGINAAPYSWDRSAIRKKSLLIKEQSNKKTYCLNNGIYIYNGLDEVSLKIFENKTFGYYLNDMLLLSGLFEIKLNQLVLHDSSLNSSFVYLFNGGNIIDNYLIYGYSLKHLDLPR